MVARSITIGNLNVSQIDDKQAAVRSSLKLPYSIMREGVMCYHLSLCRCSIHNMTQSCNFLSHK